MADALDALFQQMYHLELSVRSDGASLALLQILWLHHNAEDKSGVVASLALFMYVRFLHVYSDILGLCLTIHT